MYHYDIIIIKVTNVTLESKIVDYERVRTKLESNISDLISIKNVLEAKLSSPEVVNHDSIVKDYENKLVNVDQGYRSIVSQLEDRVALLDEENNTLIAGKLQSDKEFADLIYSARYIIVLLLTFSSSLSLSLSLS